MRLDKFLAQAKVSRKEMKQKLRLRQIIIDGQPARSLSQNVDSGLQSVSLAGRSLSQPAHRYFLMNKPAGAVTANSDADKTTVLDLIAPEDFNDQLYSVGRLDRDTRGLLLITDNGPLGFQLLHPQYHIKKTYYVEVNGPLAQAATAAFQHGIVFLDGTQCKPAQLEIHTANPKHSTASVTISEGKFHQIKKMFLAVGVKVTYLKRTHFGDFQLDPNLAEGEYRPLRASELEIIKQYLEQTW